MSMAVITESFIFYEAVMFISTVTGKIRHFAVREDAL